jgi:hypothetical protein
VATTNVIMDLAGLQHRQIHDHEMTGWPGPASPSLCVGGLLVGLAVLAGAGRVGAAAR